MLIRNRRIRDVLATAGLCLVLQPVAATDAAADRCDGLVSSYNAFNREYVQTFKGQQKDHPCSRAFWQKHDRMEKLTREKLRVARSLERSGCRRTVTGGHTAAQLEKAISVFPEHRRKLQSMCAQMDAFKKRQKEGCAQATEARRCPKSKRGKGRNTWQVRNTCPFRVAFILETTKPPSYTRKETDRYELGKAPSTDYIAVESGSEPVVVSASCIGAR